jgi:hypothetical protein
MDWVGLAGFVVALILAGIRVWEAFRKSQFELYCEWAQAGNDYALELVVANVGWRKDSLVSMRFRTPARAGDPPTTAWYQWDVRSSEWPPLPAIVLDANEVTPAFVLPLAVLDRAGMGRLKRELLDGNAEAVLANAKNKVTTLPIPPPPSRAGGPSVPTPAEVK